MFRILVVDDKKSMREFISEALIDSGFEVQKASDGLVASDMINKKNFDVVVTDCKMPGMNGLELLRKIKENSPDTMVIVMTAYGTVESAVEAIKIGAFDYICKPFSIEELNIVINNALEKKKLIIENEEMKRELKKKYNFNLIVGKSPKMMDVFNLVEKVVDSTATVIIYGESGTGKELIARAIHENGERSDKPFIKVNCAAIPETLLESELFGHEKGAFTGAIKRKLGRFELADTGTIFLDEIGDLPVSVQVKLLRVIQTREFERIGGMDTIKVNVRIISATSRDLKKSMEVGTFREDLYYRLNVIPIQLPSLRERPEDVPFLVHHFLDNFSKSDEPVNIPHEVMNALCAYSWPGNVRELENVIERVLVIGTGKEIDYSDLPHGVKEMAETSSFSRNFEGMKLNEAVEMLEMEMLREALIRCNYNQTKTAERLGINRGSLIYKIKKYDLSTEHDEE